MPERSRFLLYYSGGRPSATVLASALDIPCGTVEEMPDERLDYLVRYGCTSRIRYVPNIRTINRRSKIAGNTNKLRSLQKLKEFGIRVPKFSTEFSDLSFPMLGRRNHTSRGRSIVLYLQPRDIELANETHTHFTEYVPKKREWRVHVCNGRIIQILEKDVDPENTFLCSNEGWRYRSMSETHRDLVFAISAVGALDLDFGGVDILEGLDGNIYVLEVNTAPGIDDESRTLNSYVRELKLMMEMF